MQHLPQFRLISLEKDVTDGLTDSRTKLNSQDPPSELGVQKHLQFVSRVAKGLRIA